MRASPSGNKKSEKAPKQRTGILRSVGLGIITGACDDDPSAIGTYASAGAKFGLSFLWFAPFTFPMMYVVVYLSSKLGQVSGQGLFHVIKEHFPRWLLWLTLFGVLLGNTIEAAADLGGMAAATALLIPIPVPVIVVIEAAIILGLQIWGSYDLIRRIFRWLALTLLAYVGSALLARPDIGEVFWGTIRPTIEFNREFLTITVAVIGTTLSAYLYTWQSNVEVEEKIAKGETTSEERLGTTSRQLQRRKRDIVWGMLFSNIIMFFIILSTGATLHKAGQTQIETAAQAAAALGPIAGDMAGLLFTLGIVSVGFLAVPIMTTGAAYDLCQALGWKSSLHARPKEAPAFYACVSGFTVVAVTLNFLGFNPMHALVWSGVVQGFSTPPLLFLILLMTNNRRIMGNRTNGWWTNLLGGLTLLASFGASIGLIATSFL
jgi:NRAMP (natural resistance-associated macrophage protein)-like metal ion transporter